jgi:hypothetical protein
MRGLAGVARRERRAVRNNLFALFWPDVFRPVVSSRSRAGPAGVPRHL